MLNDRKTGYLFALPMSRQVLVRSRNVYGITRHHRCKDQA